MKGVTSMSSRSDVKLTVKPSRSSRRSTTGPASWRCDALSLETFGIFIASFVRVVCLTVRRADSEVLGKSNLGPGDGTLVGAGAPKSNTTVACPERAPNVPRISVTHSYERPFTRSHLAEWPPPEAFPKLRMTAEVEERDTSRCRVGGRDRREK